MARVDQRLLVFDNEPTEMLTRDKKCSPATRSNVLVDSFLCWRIADPLRFVQTVRTRPEAEARLLDLTASELGAAVGSEPLDSFLRPGPAPGPEPSGDPQAEVSQADDPRPGLTKLREVAERARRQVHELALASFGIEVVDLEINGFNLPRQNRKSVIERMRAERARIATRYRSEGEEEALKIKALATAEREQVLAEARAEAEVLRGRATPRPCGCWPRPTARIRSSTDSCAASKATRRSSMRTPPCSSSRTPN